MCTKLDSHLLFSFALELRFPPYVFLETDEYVRIVGEELKIRCTTHNPNFNYNVTWKYTTKSVSMRHFGNILGRVAVMILSLFFFSVSLQKVTVEEKVRSSGENRLDIQSILTISAVDLADTGNISCIGTNEAGVNSSTTYLLVVGKPPRHLAMFHAEKNLEHLSVTCNMFDSSEKTSPSSGCRPSCPLNWPTRAFQSR